MVIPNRRMKDCNSCCYQPVASGFKLFIKLKPNAPRDTIIGVIEQQLVVAVAAAPVENKANQRLIKFIAKLAQVAPSCITLISGQHHRNKTLLLPAHSCLVWLETINPIQRP